LLHLTAETVADWSLGRCTPDNTNQKGRFHPPCCHTFMTKKLRACSSSCCGT
jgi:hypothetical protein